MFIRLLRAGRIFVHLELYLSERKIYILLVDNFNFKNLFVFDSFWSVLYRKSINYNFLIHYLVKINFEKKSEINLVLYSINDTINLNLFPTKPRKENKKNNKIWIWNKLNLRTLYGLLW